MVDQVIRYDLGKNEDENWVISETEFNPDALGKTESIFCLGNGYMGQRASTEESYTKEKRNLFIAGTFNKFADNEVTELPNAADVLWVDIILSGSLFNLERGKIINYKKSINLKKAELIRDITWESPDLNVYKLKFRRFISLENKNLIAQRIEITPLIEKAYIEVKSGINGQVTNSGVQHFKEGNKTFYKNKYLQIVQTTTESNIDFIFSSTHGFKNDDKTVNIDGLIGIDRRQAYIEYKPIQVDKDKTLIIDKLSVVVTNRDAQYNDICQEELASLSLEYIQNFSEVGYESLFKKHIKAWWEKVWDAIPITIESDNNIDQLAIRFAQYHITVMSPIHDNRMNIGAKGLSGEGYKGHTFWDTEIFLLPYFIYSNPAGARSLLEYRYNTLASAHKKAKENGYEGAMFPWESAWLEDGEVTPVWGAADIFTGKATKIWSGFIEQHITSDVAFATWQYYQITNDKDFMYHYGYELLMDTAKFWVSRLEWDEVKGEYQINNVIGPDEYKEHVNNNAFTNYTAYWNIKKAIEYYHLLKKDHKDLFKALNLKLNLNDTYEKWESRVNKIYLPKPREEDKVIPQDDTYLSKKIIDLEKYKNQTNVGSMFKEYNLEQVNNIQVSKQADIMILFYLLEDMFDKDIKKANWEYYEPKTLHDSSLSLSTHSVLACDMGNDEMAYNLFKRATEIDMGPNMKTSDHGIHAASLGGIWQCVVNGFGGVRMLNGQLRISPSLPKAWKKLQFPICWHGDLLLVTITRNSITIENKTMINKEIEILMYDKKILLKDIFTYN